jgi:transcriptional regulator with XRE-family HTH domain
MEFIKIIDRLLKEKGVSAHKMSQDLGLGNSTYTHWKNRGSIPTGDILQKIADYFGVSTDYLLGRSDNPSPIGEVSAAQISGGADYSDLPQEAIEKLKAYEADLRKIYKKE